MAGPLRLCMLLLPAHCMATHMLSCSPNVFVPAEGAVGWGVGGRAGCTAGVQGRCGAQRVGGEARVLLAGRVQSAAATLNQSSSSMALWSAPAARLAQHTINAVRCYHLCLCLQLPERVQQLSATASSVMFDFDRLSGYQYTQLRHALAAAAGRSKAVPLKPTMHRCARGPAGKGLVLQATCMIPLVAPWR